MNKLYNVGYLTLLLLLLAACGKDNPPPASQPPSIASVSPTSGVKGTMVTINGANFSATAGDNTVKFNGKEAVVTAATATVLTVEVPAKAGDGAITVEVAGKAATGPSFDHIETYNVSTFAGGSQGYADGTGKAAKFNTPLGIGIDAAGNLYVSDAGNHRIRKLTPAGVVTTFAGDGVAGLINGTSTSARFNVPFGIAIDASGNVYVADNLNHSIRRITPAGQVSTFVGNGIAGYSDATGISAQFKNPAGIAIKGNTIFVADRQNHRIRKITLARVVSTLAGSTSGFVDGAGTNAKFNSPIGIAVDAAENIYVADHQSLIRKITSDGVVTTLAGNGTIGFADGPGASAKFNFSTGIVADAMSNLYVTDYSNNRIRKITSGGIVSTVAGSSTAGDTDGPDGAAEFSLPSKVVMDAYGDLYITEYNNHRVRKITIE